jgi:hypothetical protein
MSSSGLTEQQETQAGRIRAMGGGGLPSAALDIFHDRELKHRQVKADRRFSAEHRTEQLAAIDADAEQQLFDANERDVAAARKPLEAERAKLLAEAKGTTGMTPAGTEFFTTDERHERSARATREALTLNTDIAVASGTDDPDDLLEIFDTAMLSENPQRIRHLGQVVVGRLGALIQQHGGRAHAPAALTAAEAQARITFGAWKTKHPAPIARLRQIDKSLAAVRQPIDAAYTRAKETFRIGAFAHGMRM